MKDIYWNSNGKHQLEYQELYSTLVPAEGNAGTVEGEMIRAATRLYYDYYNNGMLNNTSGACQFLMECNTNQFLNIGDELLEVYQESNTGCYTDVSLSTQLETILDTVVEYIVSLNGEYTESDVDMFNFQDPDYDDYNDYDGDEDDEDEYLWETDDVLADREYDELRFED